MEAASGTGGSLFQVWGCGSERATRGGSFWTRIRWGKAVAAPGRLGPKVRSGEARFGLELDGHKLWRRQVFRARMGARKERKVFF